MKTEKIKLNQIKPVDYNPRRISKAEFNKLINNLREFGLVDPIVINLKNYHIVGGHQRYFAIKEEYGNAELDLLRLNDIGWVFFNNDLEIKSEEYEKALNISLNKLSGEWDIEKLSKLLTDIEESEFDNDLSGFKPADYELYNDDVDILDDIFFIKTQSSYAQTTVTCPNCKHEFYDS